MGHNCFFPGFFSARFLFIERFWIQLLVFDTTLFTLERIPRITSSPLESYLLPVYLALSSCAKEGKRRSTPPGYMWKNVTVGLAPEPGTCDTGDLGCHCQVVQRRVAEIVQFSVFSCLQDKGGLYSEQGIYYKGCRITI
jgi:hypothetical protein